MARMPLKPTRRHTTKAKVSALVRIRMRRRMSQRDVAACMGCDKSVVCNWETYRREPSREFRKAYAKALRISVGRLGRIVYEATHTPGAA